MDKSGGGLSKMQCEERSFLENETDSRTERSSILGDGFRGQEQTNQSSPLELAKVHSMACRKCYVV